MMVYKKVSLAGITVFASFFLVLAGWTTLSSNGIGQFQEKTAIHSNEQRQLDEATGEVPEIRVLGTAVASWYGPGFQGKLMANGEPFDTYKLTVAHKTLPFGTHLQLRNPENGNEVVVKVTDRGPYPPGRDIDLSFAAARALGTIREGVARIQIVNMTKT